MPKKFICLLSLVLLTLFQASPAFPWGSLYPGETHQYIINTAYNRLKADPALAFNLFPPFSFIQGHEGVKWTADGLFGVGPDGKGMSAYSDHYYNPVTGEGNGPNAAAKYFTYLARENAAHKVTTEACGKAAAWSAHYLADMFVPYHVIGITRRNAERLWNEQNVKHPGVINLGYSVIGSYKLSYATPVKGGDRNFNTELFRFLTRTEPAEADWFDPWYYNGNTEALMIKTSSHVAWEAAPSFSMLSPGTIIGEYQRRAGQGLPGYNPQWKNAAPSFKNPWEGQADQVRRIAILSATETRTQIENYFNDPTPALAKTVQTVYSLWRSSFSGLRPAIEFQPDGPNSYKVTATIGNSAGAVVNSIQAKLTAQGCTVADEAVKTIKGSIAPGASLTTSAWKVITTNELCRPNLEVIGSYPIPDLQYAAVERTFLPSKNPTPGPGKGSPGGLDCSDYWRERQQRARMFTSDSLFHAQCDDPRLARPAMSNDCAEFGRRVQRLTSFHKIGSRTYLHEMIELRAEFKGCDAERPRCIEFQLRYIDLKSRFVKGEMTHAILNTEKDKLENEYQNCNESAATSKTPQPSKPPTKGSKPAGSASGRGY
jgi:hypothetical protein